MQRPIFSAKASGMGMGMPPAGMSLPMGMNPCMGSMQGMHLESNQTDISYLSIESLRGSVRDSVPPCLTIWSCQLWPAVACPLFNPRPSMGMNPMMMMNPMMGMMCLPYALYHFETCRSHMFGIEHVTNRYITHSANRFAPDVCGRPPEDEPNGQQLFTCRGPTTQPTSGGSDPP